ncbi:MAG TPA: hypothetical protein DEB60_06430 [Brevundimonas sp.]|nr:hypothetical protein [Brevundimonas sp.]
MPQRPGSRRCKPHRCIGSCQPR